MSRIQYGIHRDGYAVSRVESYIAWPVLDFDAIGNGGKDKDINTGVEGDTVYEVGFFTGPTRHNLEKMHVFDVSQDYPAIRWTRLIPLEVKNYHRAFWGMKPLKK